MPDPPPLEQSIAERIIQANEASLRRLNDLRPEDYPTNVPRDFLAVLKAAHTALGPQFRALAAKIAEEHDTARKEILLLELRLKAGVVYSLHSYFQIALQARLEYVAPSSSILVERLGKNAAESRFLLIPEYDFNYDYEEIRNRLEWLLQDAVGDVPAVQTAMAQLGKRLGLLRFPLAARDTILLNAILAHEIGHAITQAGNLVAPITENLSVEPDKLALLVKARVPDPAAPDAMQREGDARRQIMKEITRTVEGWADELLCDALAVGMLGPVFLISFSEWLLSDRDLDHTDSEGTHPPTRARIRVMIGVLEKAGFTKMLSNVTGDTADVASAAVRRIDELRTLVSAPRTHTYPGQLDLKVAAVEGLSKAIIERTASVLGAEAYKPETLNASLEPLVELLSAFVPPAAAYDLTGRRMEPADPISILNVGALYILGRRKEVADKLKEADKKEWTEIAAALEAIVTNAVEGSRILDRLRKAGTS